MRLKKANGSYSTGKIQMKRNIDHCFTARWPLLTGLLLVIFTVLSCSKPETKIPQGVLSKMELVPILVDIHIAQAATGLYNAGDSSHHTMNDYIPYILKIHKVERAVYDSTIAFYTLHPEILQEMYDEVISELSKKQGEVSSK